MNSKKFILGFPTYLSYISLEELDNFCNKYQNNIEAWYAHPPFGGSLFNGRSELNCDYTDNNILLLKKQLEIISKYNLKSQVAFNNSGWLDNPISQLRRGMYRYQKLFGKVEYLITFDKFAKELKTAHPALKLVRTYNDSNIIDPKAEIFEYCDLVVLGEKHLRNIVLMQELKRYHPHLQIELLLNACHPFCNKDCGDVCDNLFVKYIQKFEYEGFCANSILLPGEINLLNPYIDFYKISVTDISTLNNYFNIYCTFTTISMEDQKEWLLSGINEALGSPLRRQQLDLADYLSLDDLDFDKIIKLKNNYWTEQLGRPVDIMENICG